MESQLEPAPIAKERLMADQREDRSEASQEVLMESQLVPAPIAKVRLMTDARRAGLAGRADSSRDCLGWKAAGVSGGDGGGVPTSEIS